MISELIGTFTSNYPPLQHPTLHSSASAIDRELSFGETDLLAEGYRDVPGIELADVAEWNRERHRYVDPNFFLPATGVGIAFPDYPENVTVEPAELLIAPFFRVDTIELCNSAEADLARDKKQAWETHRAYRDRIDSLRKDAEIDGFNVNSESEWDFWSFLDSVPLARKANLVLLENGNLRAVWDGANNSHFALQFLGEHTVQYVIFRRRAGSRHVSRVAGRDTFVGVKKQVRTFNLEGFLGT